jgi:hypothetical protein
MTGIDAMDFFLILISGKTRKSHADAMTESRSSGAKQR